MIKDSLYFTFAGRRSTDFGLININTSNGLFDDSVMSKRSITETSVRGNPIPYLTEVKREPKSFQLSFTFTETWNDDLIEEILDWLDVDHYEPMSFNADRSFNRIYYAMPIDDVSLIHNGLKQGYVTINFRCNSPYAYSPFLESRFNCTENNGVNYVEINNLGRIDLKPIIKIKKVGAGEVRITNMSIYSPVFRIYGLKDGEEIEFHSEKEIIESSLDIPRYDNFNDEYLSLPYGVNNLKIEGSCVITFKYRYTFR